jgi:DNA-binding transcriptional regulator LsrR (DeoR family)
MTDYSHEIDMIRGRIARFPSFQSVFGGPNQPGVIDQLDAIVTSCGNAHHYNQFWTTEMTRLGVSPEKLNSLTRGNIGGVLLAREDLGCKDQDLLADLARRWTGIKLQHYQQCARREPGVILLALGYNKAEVVLHCVELGLVTELVIDEELAVAIWDIIHP